MKFALCCSAIPTLLSGCGGKNRPAEPSVSSVSDSSITTSPPAALSPSEGRETSAPLAPPEAHVETIARNYSLEMVSPYEVRLTFAPANPPVWIGWGTLLLDGADGRSIPLLQTQPGTYLTGLSPVALQPPVSGMLRLYADNIFAGETSVTLAAIKPVSNPEFSGPANPINAPKVTSATAGMIIGPDEAAFGLTGDNLADARLFFRSGKVEKLMPLDEHTTTSMIILDATLLHVVPEGASYDAVVRNHHGESVVKGVFTRNRN